MTKDEEKIRENRLRRAAQRQGLMLAKSRRRDIHATDYGTYMLLDAQASAVVASGARSGYRMSLDDIEAELKGEFSTSNRPAAVAALIAALNPPSAYEFAAIAFEFNPPPTRGENAEARGGVVTRPRTAESP
jgi:hypothetical protein